MIKTVHYPVLDKKLCVKLHTIFSKYDFISGIWEEEENDVIIPMIMTIVDFFKDIENCGFIPDYEFSFECPMYCKKGYLNSEQEFKFEDDMPVSKVAACMELTGLTLKQVASIFKEYMGRVYKYGGYYVTLAYEPDDQDSGVEMGNPRLIFNEMIDLDD